MSFNYYKTEKRKRGVGDQAHTEKTKLQREITNH